MKVRMTVRVTMPVSAQGYGYGFSKSEELTAKSRRVASRENV